jgi:hypothetical protein
MTTASTPQELERTRPFGVLADTLACTGSSPDPRRRAIAALLTTRLDDRGPLTVSSDPGLQFQAVDAFGDLIEALALHGPLVVAVDDLQWADPCSLLTLGTLGGRLATRPSRRCGPPPSSVRAARPPSCRRPRADRPWSWRRCWPRRSGPASWRRTATVSGSATTSSTRPSTMTFPSATPQVAEHLARGATPGDAETIAWLQARYHYDD